MCSNVTKMSKTVISRNWKFFWIWILVVIGVIIIVAFICKHLIFKPKVEYNGCMDGLDCLPLSECERTEKYTCTCGVHEQVCCLPKVDNFTNASTKTRLAKLALLPKQCGMRPATDKITKVQDKFRPQHERLANGINATIGEFPWMALLGHVVSPKLPMQYFCGGTIINKKYILTAAHCTTNPTITVDAVTLGELNLRTDIDCIINAGIEVCADAPVIMKVEKATPHPMFNSTSLKHDIALLRLEHSIPNFTDFIQPICLPLFKIDEEYLRYRDFMISGWGKESATSLMSTILRQAHVRTSELDSCNALLQAQVKPINIRQICAMGDDFKEACRSDSGGPLMDFVIESLGVQYMQIGIISFKSLDTCGTEPNVPTVFTNVGPYLNWILETIEL